MPACDASGLPCVRHEHGPLKGVFPHVARVASLFCKEIFFCSSFLLIRILIVAVCRAVCRAVSDGYPQKTFESSKLFGWSERLRMTASSDGCKVCVPAGSSLRCVAMSGEKEEGIFAFLRVVLFVVLFVVRVFCVLRCGSGLFPSSCRLCFDRQPEGDEGS